jgi:ribosomal protein S18 acetylase RimI-like enzyme
MIDAQRIRTVSALLLTDDGKLVAQLRDDKPELPFPNCWSTLGGRVEEGETPDAALRRELIEEIEFCPPMRYWRTFELHFQAYNQPYVSEVWAYVGYMGCSLSAVHLHEGQRLGAFGLADLDGAPFAFGLDQLFRDFWNQPPLLPTRVTLADRDDAPLVHRIMQAAFAEYQGVLNPPSGVHAETVEDVRQAMTQGGAVLAWIGDAAVGSARFRFESDHLYVGRVSVLPEFRKQGIAQDMMRYLEGIAQQQHKPCIHVGVRMSLPHNLAFYQRLGYSIIAIEDHPRGPDRVATLVKTL